MSPKTFNKPREFGDGSKKGQTRCKGYLNAQKYTCLNNAYLCLTVKQSHKNVFNGKRP